MIKTLKFQILRYLCFGFSLCPEHFPGLVSVGFASKHAVLGTEPVAWARETQNGSISRIRNSMIFQFYQIWRYRHLESSISFDPHSLAGLVFWTVSQRVYKVSDTLQLGWDENGKPSSILFEKTAENWYFHNVAWKRPSAVGKTIASWGKVCCCFWLQSLYCLSDLWS